MTDKPKPQRELKASQVKKPEIKVVSITSEDGKNVKINLAGVSALEAEMMLLKCLWYIRGEKSYG